MPSRPLPDRRLPALLLGLGLALGLLFLAEARLRAQERGEVVFVAEPPGLKYAYPPGGGERVRGWVIGRDPPEHAPDVRRVLFVGDSVTYGVHVSPKETYAARVLTTLQAQGRFEGFNFGMNGYDAEQVAALVTGALSAWQPDLLIWGSYANDLQPTRMLYRKDGGEPVYVGTDIPDAIRLLPGDLDARLLRHSAAWRRLLGARYARHARGRTDIDDSNAFYGRHLQRILDWGRSQGVPVLVLAIPPHVLASPERCPESAGDPSLCQIGLRRHEQITALLSDHGARFVDALPALQASGQPHFHPPGRQDPDHPGPEGHRLLARTLLPAVQAILDLPVGEPDLAPAPKVKKSSRDFPLPGRP